MGLLSLFKTQDIEKKSIGVCIPEHTRVKKKEKKKETNTKKVSSKKETISKGKLKGTFKVSGKFDIGKTLMLAGGVESGELRKGMKAKVKGIELKITELRTGPKKVSMLNTFEDGSIFVKSKSYPDIRYDNLINFKN